MNVIADSALVGQIVGVVDELQPARFPRPVFLGALLPEVAPFPVTAAPSNVVKVAHPFFLFVVFVGRKLPEFLPGFPGPVSPFFLGERWFSVLLCV